MEYAVVSSKDYYEDQKIANTILQASAIDNHKDIRDLRAIWCWLFFDLHNNL